MWEVAAEPVRDARWQRGDDDLVESTSLNRLLHGARGTAGTRAISSIVASLRRPGLKPAVLG
jgi:hypothetical protein